MAELKLSFTQRHPWVWLLGFFPPVWLLGVAVLVPLNMLMRMTLAILGVGDWISIGRIWEWIVGAILWPWCGYAYAKQAAERARADFGSSKA